MGAVIKNIGGRLALDLANDLAQAVPGFVEVDGYGQVRKRGATYRFAPIGIAPAANPTDVMNIRNPAGSGKLVLIDRVAVAGQATTAATILFTFVRRTGTNTGATLATASCEPSDTANPLSAAQFDYYNANPSVLAAAGGNLASSHMNLPLSGSSVDRVDIQFGALGGQPVVIRPGEIFAWNLGGAAMPAGTVLDYMVEFREAVL